MMPDEDAQRLLVAVQALYDEVLLDELPTWRGHCREVSRAAYIVGRAMGLPCRLCRGSRMLPGPVADKHGWLRIGDLILHSPERGVVLLEPWSESFREEWAAGA